MDWNWMVWSCFFPTIHQAFLVSLSILGPSVFLRIIVLYSGLSNRLVNTLASVLGIFVLWWFYSTSVTYFLVLCGIVYTLLLMVRQQRGAVVAVGCVAFILSCELFIVSRMEWHRVRGSFLVAVMKNISLAFDLDSRKDSRGEKKPPNLASVPDLPSYTSYCLFPGTTVFGPFLTYSEHSKFLHPTPLTMQWIWKTLSSLVLSAICLGMSVCILPFLFTEPQYNKWLAAFSAAASFRYSHYFVCFLSESSTIASGIGYNLQPDNTVVWSDFHVVHPMAIEFPRSMPLVVTHWNLPMHVFLKNYVFKPSRYYLGQFSAILITFIASSLLHVVAYRRDESSLLVSAATWLLSSMGFNAQLTAVLLTLGLYAYIESVLRKKLSKRLNACVLDRPCSEACGHRFDNDVWWVLLVNIGFTLLNMFHLAYLGVMFGGSVEDESADLELEGYSLSHTLRKWTHLNFLSHWVAIASYILSQWAL